MAPARRTTRRTRAAAKRTTRTNRSHKAIIREYFELVGEGKFQDGLRFFADDCRTHNPYFAGDMHALAAGQAAASQGSVAQYPDPAFTVEHVLEDGDLVAVHTHLLSNRANPSEGGLRQIHLFRFKRDKIVEYWDISQGVTPDLPNASGAF